MEIPWRHRLEAQNQQCYPEAGFKIENCNIADICCNSHYQCSGREQLTDSKAALVQRLLEGRDIPFRTRYIACLYERVRSIV
jgi:hypothetical protein